MLTLASFVVLSFVLSSSVKASEGVFELSNTQGEASRCFAFSALMQDLNYRILVSCRDILYPGDSDVFQYATWANPDTGERPIKLGNLGLGKVEFKTSVPFLSLFVTRERKSDAKTPSGDIIMQGSRQPIEFLERQQVSRFEQPELGEPEVSPTPTPKPQSSRSSFSNLIRLGGTIGFIALFVTVLMVFLITRR